MSTTKYTNPQGVFKTNPLLKPSSERFYKTAGQFGDSSQTVIFLWRFFKYGALGSPTKASEASRMELMAPSQAAARAHGGPT